MSTSLTPTSELSFLSIGPEILGYNPLPNMASEDNSPRSLMEYLDETLSKDIIPSVIIKYKGKNRAVNCFVSSVKETHYAKFYFMEDVLNKKSHGILVMAVPKNPDSISPPCLVHKSNSKLVFKPYSEKEMAEADRLLKEFGF